MKKLFVFKNMIVAAAIISGFAACKKDRTVVYVNNIPNQNLSQQLEKDPGTFWKDYLPPVQKFTINTSTGGAIQGSKGSYFYIGAGALTDAAGNPVTGNADVELIEYMNKSDMLFSGVTTGSGTELLESGGMFYMSVKQNGADLKFKNGKYFSMYIPQTNNTNDPMDFFTGTATGNANKVNWILKDTVKARPQKDTGGQRASFFLQFNYFQFGYCNIDRYFNQFKTKCSKFRIKMPKKCNDTNSTALLLFKQYNSCAWCNWMTTENRVTTYYSLPVGETIKVLVYRKTGKGDDDIEYSLMEYTLVDDTEVPFADAMTPCTKAQLADIIKAL